MLRRFSKPLSLLTAMLMAWTAMWCCCAATATAAQPPARDEIKCPACHENGAAAGSASTMPMHAGEDCPIIKLRAMSVLPDSVAVPAFNDDAVPLPEWLTPVPVTVCVACDVARLDLPKPMPSGQTLLAMHTSLLW